MLGCPPSPHSLVRLTQPRDFAAVTGVALLQMPMAAVTPFFSCRNVSSVRNCCMQRHTVSEYNFSSRCRLWIPQRWAALLPLSGRETAAKARILPLLFIPCNKYLHCHFHQREHERSSGIPNGGRTEEGKAEFCLSLCCQTVAFSEGLRDTQKENPFDLSRGISPSGNFSGKVNPIFILN